MVEHKSIQNPEDYSDTDYQKMEYLLFSEDTDQDELEEVVMTLAHLPTKRAHELLTRFSKSDSAEKVVWLDVAMQECQFLYLSSENEEEERDLMAMKFYYQNMDRIIEMEGERQTYEYEIKMYDIELEALLKLQQEAVEAEEKDDLRYRILALQDLRRMEENKLEKKQNDIKIENKIGEKIKEGVKTERYKNLKAEDIRGICFNGEIS